MNVAVPLLSVVPLLPLLFDGEFLWPVAPELSLLALPSPFLLLPTAATALLLVVP